MQDAATATASVDKTIWVSWVNKRNVVHPVASCNCGGRRSTLYFNRDGRLRMLRANSLTTLVALIQIIERCI